jgi:chromosomal replication initiation ATPase DnaA
MNMHTSTPELLRQHQRHTEIRARLWFSRKPEPIAPRIEVIEPEEVEEETIEAVSTPAVEDDQFLIDDDFEDLPKRRSTKDIVDEVLAGFPGVTWADLKGARRTKSIIYPRHLAMYEIYAQRKNMSLPMIGRLFGGRDHTTILSAVRKIERMKRAAQ